MTAVVSSSTDQNVLAPSNLHELSVQPCSAITLRQQIWQQQRQPIIGATLMAVLSGAAGVGMIACIGAALQPQANLLHLGLGFALSCAIAIGARTAAGMLFARISQGALAQLRGLLSSQVLNAPLQQIEKLGLARTQSVATDDATHVAMALISLPNITTNAMIVLGCLTYLTYLSWLVGLIALAVIVLGSVGYDLGNRRALLHLEHAGQAQDQVFEQFGGLFAGAKELKLHRQRAQAYLDQALTPAINRVKQHKIQGFSIYSLAASWGLLLVYAFVGISTFVVGTGGVDHALAAASYTIVFLYLLLPLDTLLNNLPSLSQAAVSLQRISEVLNDTQHPEAVHTGKPVSSFTQLELRGLQHRYYQEKEERHFQFGPIDLSIAAGELVFVIGGNGSGKTTLAKLLTGLYAPEAGQVLLDGVPINAHNRDEYRQYFSAVFTDFYVFESILGLDQMSLDQQANALLKALQLDHKVSIQQGCFSTRALSQGQRKRLALVVAYLEDRPIYLFDEWAADQDPLFKEVFYTQLLPALKAKGKTVIVISHDDRYFHCADRQIKLEYGQLHDL